MGGPANLTFPNAPNPTSRKYQNSDPLAVDLAKWAASVQRRLEDFARLSAAPMGQQFAVSSFTTNTVISGTSTGTDISNFVASLVQAMTDRGFASPTISRSGQ